MPRKYQTPEAKTNYQLTIENDRLRRKNTKLDKEVLRLQDELTKLKNKHFEPDDGGWGRPLNGW